MAFGTPVTRGVLAAQTAASSIVIVPTGTIVVGRLLIACFTTRNAGTVDGATTNHQSITDSAGNTWNKVVERTNTVAGVALDGVTGSVWWTRVTAELTTSSSVTLTLSGSQDRRIGNLLEVPLTNDVNYVPIVAQAGHGDNSLTAAVSSLPSREYLFLYHGIAQGTDATKTPPTNFTERFDQRSGATTPGIGCETATRVVTATSQSGLATGWTVTANTLQSFMIAFYELVFQLSVNIVDNVSISDIPDVENSQLGNINVYSAVVALENIQVSIEGDVVNLNIEVYDSVNVVEGITVQVEVLEIPQINVFDEVFVRDISTNILGIDIIPISGGSDPLPDTDLVWYVDDDDLADGAVTTWTDRKAGTGNPTQPTTANKAAKSSSGVTFDGNDWYDDTTHGLTVGASYSMVVVGNFVTAVSSSGVWLGIHDGTRNITLSTRHDGTNQKAAAYYYDGSVTTYFDKIISNSDIHCVVVTRSIANGIRMYIDGTQVTADSTYLGIGQDFNLLTIGTVWTGDNPVPNGSIGRLFALYNKELSQADVDAIMASAPVSGKLGLPSGDPLNEIIFVSEFVDVEIVAPFTDLEINVIDSLTVSDSGQCNVSEQSVYTVNVYDAISLSDISSIELSVSVNVYDSLTVSDVANSNAIINVAIYSSIGVYDLPEYVVTDVGALSVNVYDAITVSDSVSLLKIEASTRSINVYDYIKVLDYENSYGANLIPSASSNFNTDGTSYWSGSSVTIVWNTSGWMDLVCQGNGYTFTFGRFNVMAQFRTYLISLKAKSDHYIGSLGVDNGGTLEDSEGNTYVTNQWKTFSTIFYAQYNGHLLFFSVGSMDLNEILSIDDITVQEIVSVSSATLEVIVNSSVYDSIVVSDFKDVALQNLTINIYDSLSISDSGEYTVSALGVYSVNVYDVISVSDSGSAEIIVVVSVYDNLTLADAVTTARVDAGTVEINVFSSLALSDTPNIDFVALNASVYDLVTASDAGYLLPIETYISVYDRVSVADSVSFFFDQWNLSVYDLIAVGDEGQYYVLEADVFMISVYDGIAVRDEPSFLFAAMGINVHSSVAVADSVFMQRMEADARSISVYSAVAVSESIFRSLNLSADVNDIISVADSSQIVVTEAGGIYINVYDSISVAENILRENLLSGINVSDRISVYDYLEIRSLINISSYDSIAVNDVPTVFVAAVPMWSINVYDAIGVSDFSSANISVSISVYDSVNVFDTVFISMSASAISVWDNIAVREFNSFFFDRYNLSIYDSISISDSGQYYIEEAGVLMIIMHDVIGVADVPSFTFSDMAVNVFDRIVVSNIPFMQREGLALNISIYDLVSVGEYLAFTGTMQTSVYDAITISDIGEYYTLEAGVISINVFDRIAVAENLTFSHSIVNVSVYDGVTVADIPGPIPGALEIRSSDSLGVVDYVTGVQLGASGIYIWDNISIADFSETVSGIINLSVWNFVSVSDSAVVMLVSDDKFISVYDFISVSDEDTITVETIYVSVYDTLNVKDISLSIGGDTYISIYDSVTASDIYHDAIVYDEGAPKSLYIYSNIYTELVVKSILVQSEELLLLSTIYPE